MATPDPRGDVTIYEAELHGTVGPLTFLKPLTVIIEVGDRQVVIADDTYLRYGAGATPEEALHNYIEDLVVYYEITERNAALFAADAALLAALRDTFVFRAEPWRPD